MPSPCPPLSSLPSCGPLAFFVQFLAESGPQVDADEYIEIISVDNWFLCQFIIYIINLNVLQAIMFRAFQYFTKVSLSSSKAEMPCTLMKLRSLFNSACSGSWESNTRSSNLVMFTSPSIFSHVEKADDIATWTKSIIANNQPQADSCWPNTC